MLDLIPSLHAASMPGGGELLQLLPLALVFVVMYFFFIRTQQKKDKQHKEMLESLKVGETVVTQSGLIGRIKSFVGEQEILLTLTDDVDVRFLKSMVIKILEGKEPKQVRNLKKTKAAPKASSKNLSSKKVSSVLKKGSA